MLLERTSIFLKPVLKHKFLILATHQPDIYIYVSKDMRIHRYFRSRKGSTSNKSW